MRDVLPMRIIDDIFGEIEGKHQLSRRQQAKVANKQSRTRTTEILPMLHGEEELYGHRKYLLKRRKIVQE